MGQHGSQAQCLGAARMLGMPIPRSCLAQFNSLLGHRQSRLVPTEAAGKHDGQ